MMTNGELIQSDFHDQYCVSIRPPELLRDRVRIQILEDDPAIAIHNIKEKPYHIHSVREGKLNHLWLLSSGVLLFDEKMQLAMGKRNYHSSDPGRWTHMAAGRCDNKIKEHALKELAEEFHCYIKEKEKNLTVRLIPDIIQQKDWLPFILMQKAIQYDEYRWIPFRWCTLTELTGIHVSPWKNLEIIWPDETEELEGFVFIDEMNRTVEIRLIAQIDLKQFHDTQLIYPEGDMEAEWLALDTLIYLRHREKREQLQFFVPFMQYFLDTLSQTYSRSGDHYHIL